MGRNESWLVLKDAITSLGANIDTRLEIRKNKVGPNGSEKVLVGPNKSQWVQIGLNGSHTLFLFKYYYKININ